MSALPVGCSEAEQSHPQFLSVEQFAAISGISKVTVRRLISDGRLPSWQPGGKRCRILIPRSAIEQLHPATGPEPVTAPQSVATTASQAPLKVARSSTLSGPAPRWLRR